MFSALIIPVQPVAAHVGSRAEPHLSSLTLESVSATRWTARAVLVDADSGTPLPGFHVALRGSGPAGRFGPLVLTDAGNSGGYSAEIDVVPGPWTLAVDVEAVIGGPDGIPITKRFDVVLTSGRSTEAGSPASSAAASTRADTKDSWGWAKPWAAVVGVAVLAGVLLARLVRERRRTPEPRRHAQPLG